MASSEAQKPNTFPHTPNGSASTHTPNARRKVMMDFSSLHPCSVSMDEDDEKEEENIHSRSHPSYHPASSYSSSSSTPTQSSQNRSIINNNARLEYYNASSLGNESTHTATTSRFRSKSKSKSTTAHVHFLDQVIETNTTAAASANVNASRKRSTPSDLDTNTTTNEEKGMTLGPRSRDLSLSESEISLLDLGPSLVYGDDGYMPLSNGGYNGQGDEGGGVSLVGRGVQGLCLEGGGDGGGLRE
ncbi:hypothetical protein ASPBRDRAFT_39085 [Aspergillus brasiliensis CBS 101740]|uniref:Uncharacterized protein n=1 Tax=Aspergillus brasiliensis (strain CBS 101740 / IMI 381727 / IBT 21946) TaxID=767769 RepID=A0A1L9UYD7_ASPBC|nr:hypothetical protein ASPBRDRAFT_39085 [Aspergillus brasiliensis CBS 101740]